MGALHAGHLSLVEKALSNNDKVVVSIFVNPTQFNDPEDLKRYPRNLEADLSLLEKYPVEIVFAPTTEEMYPEKNETEFNLAPLDSVMEGKYRPGHFNGVAQIVNKLFLISTPDRAYFGMKDFQQLAIIKRLVKIQQLPVEIVPCTIVREKNGLAMSSRNQLLSSKEREAASLINKTLLQAGERFKDQEPKEIIFQVKEAINNHPLMNVEYFEIVDDQSLMSIKSWGDSKNNIGCIAVQIGKVRLIDNRYFI
jgi:pantoate--beta-alanine ligase